MSSNISILILTKNEEHDISGCLDSVSWSDDIHVYDSMSADSTVEIAKQFGAVVTQREYGDELAFGGDEAAHRNWGLKNIKFKYEWVFIIDADERMTPYLIKNIQLLLASPTKHVAFSVQRRDFFMGVWLKHVQTSPFYMRLVRPEKMHYERLINPVLIADGTVGQVDGFLDHYPFSKGVDYWVERHNSYSKFEAQQIVANRKNNTPFSLVKAFIEKDFHRKRFHQKELFYRLPFRPFVKFLILYFGKKGFLDGRAGFTYAILQSIYEYFIVLKTHELEQKENK